MDYTKSTNFATKDTLPPGSALKIVRGTEIDTEFNSIATAVATKADLASPALTGSPTAPTPTAGDNDTSIATTAFVSTAVSTAVATAVNNVGYPAFKNRIINGAMMIDQRNAGASVTPSATAAFQFTVDRFAYNQSAASKFSYQQNAGSVTPPVGFSNYLGFTSQSAYSVSSSDYFYVAQRIEGNNCSDLAWGTASAAPVTLSFWVRSSLTGTFGGTLTNSAANRYYIFSYTISAANTWEQKTITIAGDTTGTWLTTNGTGIEVRWGLGSGSTFTGSAGSWSGTTYLQPTGSVNVVGTSGATFYITGVQLEKGSTATSFDYRPYGTELALCQRYFYKTYNTEVAVGTSTAVGSVYCETIAAGNLSRLKAFNPRLPVSMRTTPTVTLYSQTGTADRINVYSNSASTLTVSSLQSSGTNSLFSYVQTSTNAVAAETYEFQATAASEL